MAKAKNNPIAPVEFELTNGEVVELVITWGLLIQLRSKSKHDYQRYSKLVSGGVSDDIIGMVTIVYAGYLCGLINKQGDTKGCMTEEEFLELVPNDYSAVTIAVNGMLSPKSQRASENPS